MKKLALGLMSLLFVGSGMFCGETIAMHNNQNQQEVLKNGINSFFVTQGFATVPGFITSGKTIKKDDNKMQKIGQQRAARERLSQIFDYKISKINRMSNKDKEHLSAVFQKLSNRLDTPEIIARREQVRQARSKAWEKKYGKDPIDTSRDSDFINKFNLDKDSNDENNVDNNIADEVAFFNSFNILAGTGYENMLFDNVQEDQVEGGGAGEVSTNVFDSESTKPHFDIFNPDLMENNK